LTLTWTHSDDTRARSIGRSVDRSVEEPKHRDRRVDRFVSVVGVVGVVVVVVFVALVVTRARVHKMNNVMTVDATTPTSVILLSGTRGGVAATIAATIASGMSGMSGTGGAWDVASRVARVEIRVHDPRDASARRLTKEDVEASGGVLELDDVGKDGPEVIANVVNRDASAWGLSARLRAAACSFNGKTLDVERVAACRATSVAHCDGGGTLSQACATSEACAKLRRVNDGGSMARTEPRFVLALANAVTGCVFANDGARAESKTLYAALRPSSTAKLAEELTSADADEMTRRRDELQAALHWEFLRAHPETRPLLGITGADATKCIPGNAGDDDEAAGTASMCGIVGAVAVSKLFPEASGFDAARYSDQWLHVDALALYRPDRADAHLPPPPNKSEYDALPSEAGQDADMKIDDDNDTSESFSTQARLFGYDALDKLREMRVLVCGVDSGANDACIAALASVGVGNVDVFGASGSGRFLRRECEVDDLCDLDDFESYKYNAVIRMSALAGANEIIANVGEIKIPVIEVASPALGACSVHVNPGLNFARGAYVGWMDAPTARVAAHLAAMEVVRLAQGRERSAKVIAYDGKGIYDASV